MNDDLNDTWYVEQDDTTVNPLGNGAFRIVPYSAYTRRKEQKCSARPQYVATVYDEEIAREMVELHNAKRRTQTLLEQGGVKALFAQGGVHYIPMQLSYICKDQEMCEPPTDGSKGIQMSAEELEEERVKSVAENRIHALQERLDAQEAASSKKAIAQAIESLSDTLYRCSGETLLQARKQRQQLVDALCRDREIKVDEEPFCRDGDVPAPLQKDTAKEDKMSQIVERECFGARIYSDLENLITAARLAEQTRICKMLGGSVDNWEIAEENLKRTLLSFPETLKRN